MKIDAHQHYWLTSRKDYGWLQPSVGEIYADFMPEQLKPYLDKFQIHKTIIVQAAPTREETEFLLEIADQDETIAGVVGWLDLDSDSFERQWNELCRNRKFVGIRPMIQDLPSDWIMQRRVIRHLEVLTEAGFPIDLQANPRHLQYIIKLLVKIPELHGVINHLAKPPMAAGTMEPWCSQITEIASYQNMMCKLSGMVYGKDWTEQSIRPFAEHAIQAFGKTRVMFGSDWPVCLLSASYSQVVDLFESFIGQDWSEDEIDNVYAHNALRFYRVAYDG